MLLALILIGTFALHSSTLPLSSLFQGGIDLVLLLGFLSFPIWLLLFWFLHKRGLFTISGRSMDVLAPLAALFSIVLVAVFLVFSRSFFAGIFILLTLLLSFLYFILYPLLVHNKLNAYLNNGRPDLLLNSKYSNINYSKIKRYGYSWQKANALFQMGKWEEALTALDEYSRASHYDAYIYHYNRAIYLLFAENLSASQDAYSEFQKQLAQFPDGKVNESVINSITEQYRLLFAYKQENSKESLRNYLEFLPTIFSKPPMPANEIALNYYQGLYELHYGSVQRAMVHFDFILETESTTWYREAARLEREKGVAQ